MSDSILAALISAGASIFVALLGRAPRSRKAGSPAVLSAHHGRRVAWYVTLGALLLWLALSPAFLHHDLAGINYFAIPIVTLILALAAPLRPTTSAWIVLALYACNFVIGPMSNRLAGSHYDTQFGGFNLVYFLVIAFANTAVVSGICALRLRRPTAENAPAEDVAPANRSTLASELAKLNELHTAGALTDEEFTWAKEKLLGD